MSAAGMVTPFSKVAEKRSADHGCNSLNPFDSESDSEEETTPSKYKISPVSCEEDDGRGASSSSCSVYPGFSAARSHYENDFRDSGGFENQSVQELEEYTVYKAEKTTEKINSCLKIAEDIKEDATKTLFSLHQQGEQITRTHLNVVNVDHDLSRVCPFFIYLHCCLSVINRRYLNMAYLSIMSFWHFLYKLRFIFTYLPRYISDPF